MKTTRISGVLVAALCLTFCEAEVSEADPVGTAFTYQGQLYDANHIADGFYDFQFKLYDANTDGNQVGGDVNRPDVNVLDGYFMVEVDFNDANAFNGDARWLEIGVRPADSSGSFTKLAPRQEVTPTPYAFRSEHAKSVEQLICNFVVGPGPAVTAGDVASLINGNVTKGCHGSDFGSEYTFNAANTDEISAVALSDTRLVVAYADVGNSGYGTAIVGNVLGKTINFGKVEYVFHAATTSDISVTRLSTSRFVVAYSGNSAYGTTVVGDVEGYSISFGTESVFHAAETRNISVTGLSDTKFVVAYRQMYNDDGAARVGEAVGNGCVFGSKFVFYPERTEEISAAALSESRFVVAYRDRHLEYGIAALGDVVGYDITFGDPCEYVFNSSDTMDISAAALSESKFVVAYTNMGNRCGAAVVGETTGNTIVFGSEYLFDIAHPPETWLISAAALSDSKFVVGFRNQGDTYGWAVVGDVSGNSIAFATPYVFNSAATAYSISAAVLSDSKYVVAFGDAANSYYGTGIVGCVAVPIGIADGTAGSGQSVPVIIHGIAGHQSSLVPGQFYYADPQDGSLTLTPLSTKVGVATSSTELLLDIE